MSTRTAKAADIEKSWYTIDASGLILGRLASVIASRLRGKHKPYYTPHVDTGDYIIVLNVEKIKVTGQKLSDKIYHRHTGYPGGIKSITLQHQLAKDPTRIIQWAVKRMLPKGPLGREMFRKLYIYAGNNHPHQGQQPALLTKEDLF